MQPKIELYKKFQDKFFKNKELKEGDEVFVETVDGYKCTILKNSMAGKLIVEICERKNSKDIIVISIAELNEKYIILKPTMFDVIEILLNKNYKIIMSKDKREIWDEENLIYKKDKIFIEDLMSLCLNQI